VGRRRYIDRITGGGIPLGAKPVPDVVVIGAGMAGLTCAADLTAAGVDTLVLEASDGIGGRVRSDLVDGYRLDRGFQILLLGYPQVQKRLELERLKLGYFAAGAIVRTEDGLHRVSDPRRTPRDLFRTAATPIATTKDKLNAARLLFDVCTHAPKQLLRRPDKSTAERLGQAGLSPEFIAAFWRPLFAGIQLDPELEVSARRFDVILRMIAFGETALPADGIGAIPAQMAEQIPATNIRTNAEAHTVTKNHVTLATGETIETRAVVVATDGPAAHRLLNNKIPDPGSRAAACCWFALSSPPLRKPYLILDGEGVGPALNVVVMSEVQPAYAPPGKTLVAAAVPGPMALSDDLELRVRIQLARWFDATTGDLEPLRTDVIHHGQPLQAPPLHPRQKVDLGEGMFICGDHRDTASLQGAMFSGERTAEAVLAHLNHPI
jgi:phytoene dehydrogenase-like protein